MGRRLGRDSHAGCLGLAGMQGPRPRPLAARPGLAAPPTLSSVRGPRRVPLVTRNWRQLPPDTRTGDRRHHPDPVFYLEMDYDGDCAP
jgi:hypothetical protein